MKTHPYFVSFVLHCMFCVCTRTSSFFAYLQMTLLIHVNSMTAFNAYYFLYSETWHMISTIGHQRRLTSVILKRLTPENCHQSIITTIIHCLQECCYPFRHVWPDEYCSICSRKILKNSCTVLCQGCQRKIHTNSTDLSHEEFSLIQNCTTWFCRLGNESLFPFNHIDDDYEFTITLDQFMSGSLIPGGEFLHPDSMIFDPFEINEDEDQTVEYHGELDPDRNYFNQFSHQLNKNSNYYIEDSFNKYVKRNCYEREKYILCTPTLGVFQPI